MSTLAVRTTEPVRATRVRIAGTALLVELSDGRELGLRITEVPWLKWLAKATPEQRANFNLEPGGYAIYWPDLDDGIEVCHLLDLQPIA
jgi:hypothetical protein